LDRVPGAPKLKWTRSWPPAKDWISTWQRVQRLRLPGEIVTMTGARFEAT
jgi:hypothetical protein